MNWVAIIAIVVVLLFLEWVGLNTGLLLSMFILFIILVWVTEKTGGGGDDTDWGSPGDY